MQCLKDPPQPQRHVPVLVEAPSALIADVLSKNSLEIPQALRCFDVPHDTHHHHWGGLNDGHSLHLLPFGGLCKIAKGNGAQHYLGSDHSLKAFMAHAVTARQQRAGGKVTLCSHSRPQPFHLAPAGGPRRV